MALYKEDIIDLDINGHGFHRSFINHVIGKDDIKADRFGVRLYRDGLPVSLDEATCEGFFLAPDGQHILISGQYAQAYDNVAFVDLPQACYSAEGQFTLAIKVIGNGITGTYRMIDGMVSNTFADGALAPTENVPTYQEVLAVYDQMVEAKAGAVRFDIEQTLTTAQAEKARGNIQAEKEILIKYVGDGVTDDGAYISNQIAAYYNEGYRHFTIDAHGTATIKTPLVIPSLCTIDGHGVTLKSENQATTEGQITPTRIISMTGLSNIWIKNIRFEGSRTSGNAPDTGASDNLIYLNNCNIVNIENCSIINYDTSINANLPHDSGYDGYPHTRAELWSAIVACGCSHLAIVNMKIRKSNREFITLSRCSDFSIDKLWAYENDQYDVRGETDEEENRSYRAYSVLNLFDCYRGSLNRLYIIHDSHTSVINFFTNHTILTNSYISCHNNRTTGIDLGNEIGVDHYYLDDIISNNILRCPIRKVGIADNGYGFNRLMFIGNLVDLSHYEIATEYAINVPTGNVLFINNYIRGGVDESQSAEGFHLGNSWGRKVFIGNYIFGPTGMNIVPRPGTYQSAALPGDKEELILIGNVFSHNMVSVSDFSNIDNETSIDLKMINNISINGAAIRITKVPDAKINDFTPNTVKVALKGGSSVVRSIVRAGVTLSVIGHECMSNDYLMACDAEMSNLRIRNTVCDNGTLLHVYSNETDATHGDVSGSIYFCSAQQISEVDTGCTDATEKAYNVELNGQR